MNGYVIEHSHRSEAPSEHQVLELETKIGRLCSQLTGPVAVRSSCGGFRTAYEPLARVHMLWYVPPHLESCEAAQTISMTILNYIAVA